jgi:hypothetical protein
MKITTKHEKYKEFLTHDLPVAEVTLQVLGINTDNFRKNNKKVVRDEK